MKGQDAEEARCPSLYISWMVIYFCNRSGVFELSVLNLITSKDVFHACLTFVRH